LNVEYYSQCLQVLIESIEVCLDEGLATGEALGTEFDTDNLLRMDSVTQMEVLDKGRNVMTPNEGRRKLELPGVTGGNSVYRQQQDYSLEALSKRDAKDDPFGKDAPAPPEPANDDAETELEAAKMLAAVAKGLA
jgi:phage portal protein BeeE